MAKYQLAAFDMDGTLLNAGKQLSQENMEAIKTAADKGKVIVLSTGRCLPELEEYYELLPDVRYLICVSGAIVYDRIEKRMIYSRTMPEQLIRLLLRETEAEDPMVHFMGTASVSEKQKEKEMHKFGMGAYQELYDRVCVTVEDIRAYYDEEKPEIAKLNFYHRSLESRDRSRERIVHSGAEIEIAYADETALECNLRGNTKGDGLRRLCTYLQIPLEETIAVGDGDNDLDILKTAGLAVAMGNANEHVKTVCDVQVADCEHSGCAEAIYRFLL